VLLGGLSGPLPGIAADGFAWGYASTTVTVSRAVTTAKLTPSTNPVRAGSPVTLTVAIPFVTGFPPTGTVTFFDGLVQIGLSSISPTGTATLGLFAGAGTHSIVAQYSGDSNYLGCTSPVVSVVVNPKITTAISLTAPPSPLFAAATVNLLTKVSFPALDASSKDPTGLVILFDGPTQIGSTVVGVGGIVSLTATFAAGVHSITATYAGDVDYLGSTSAALALTVNPKLIPTITGATSPNPAPAGQTVAIGATVSFPAGSPAPAGTVTFKVGAFPIGSVPISSVVSATSVGSVLKLKPNTAGVYTLTATYNGDSAYNSVTSAPFRLTVSPITF
jgi:hypothetical protein